MTNDLRAPPVTDSAVKRIACSRKQWALCSTHRFEKIISSMHGDLGVGMPLIDHKFLTLILDLMHDTHWGEP